MEKIKFEKPELSIVLIGTEDIITTSLEMTNSFGGDVWGPWLGL